MRQILPFVVLTLLAGCAGEYSGVPDATGEWVPANPPGIEAGGQAVPLAPVITSPTIRARSAAR